MNVRSVNRSASFLTALILLTALSLPIRVMAQAPAPASLSPADQRVADLREQILNTSKDIDDGVESILDLIIPLTDTTETGNKVTQMKQSTIDSLRKTIDFYVLERQKLEGDLAQRSAALTKEQLGNQVTAIDDTVDKRVDEILRISASLAENQIVEKYEGSYDPYSEIYNRRVTDEYKQNQKVQRRVVDTKGGLSEGIRDSINTLKERQGRYERLLSYQVSAENQQVIEGLIAETKTRITERESQLNSLGTVDGEAGTKAIGKDEFNIVLKLLNDQKAEVKASFDLLRRLKGEYDAALTRANNARRMAL